MAYDEGHATLMRDDLVDLADQHIVTEKKMFGGLCFMLNGNMLCGVSKQGGMFRVGKNNEAAALAIPGVDPLSFTGRKMGGLVDVNDDLMGDDTRRAAVMALALEFVAALPAK
ncbi:TfoX/Sxy family protein [Shimia abyssi]|uniref:TfoX-like protein n=1 Tax=Shimia abyssi TaxID=1662395 RepID=A0A2P8F610_9RHOB|nr:TfoX/Sxy family protein [Shimia abyssi]PSL17163.1 TfoX-like protein [Shimia abyssi]